MKLIDKSAIDTQSLLSVCPSEPGVFNKVSSYQSSEEGGSFEDLIDTDRVRTLKRSRGPSTSFLVPTTSLPNLLPLDGDFLLSPTTPYFPSHFSEVSPSPSIEFHSRSDYVASFNSSTAWSRSSTFLCNDDDNSIHRWVQDMIVQGLFDWPFRYSERSRKSIYWLVIDCRTPALLTSVFNYCLFEYNACHVL